ncbi:V-type ATP synthase subunit D [Citroniella saccharovorans]|uniref:V-type ATP synthase subunit D n=1 Tax=Citroniella saccharovorans TaxID=2053367 RepID=A0AAW9N0E8_9FIRM|nr:V-type ATP synthase subunit D [Citroniella saccharovorans]MEB3430130.1 V-type ATP synthase subunit D [Citroniella saccharovorans]
MAILKVNPTRMQMSLLKARLKTSERGHKLLKDKQDELMRRFIENIRENKKLREEVEKALSESFKDFMFASAVMSPKMLEAAVSFPKRKLTVEVEEKNVMSVMIPLMNFNNESVDKSDEKNMYPYGYVQTSAELDDAIKSLNLVMEKLLKLAELEKTCQLMAKEIEETRRRVNALEHRTIPDLKDTIKHIRMKLEENERATITRLMKVKELIAKEN